MSVMKNYICVWNNFHLFESSTERALKFNFFFPPISKDVEMIKFQYYDI